MSILAPIFSQVNTIDAIALAGAIGMYLILIIGLIFMAVAIRMFLSLPGGRK
jgi:hypothetical protein